MSQQPATERKFEWWWIGFGLLLIVVVVAAVMINRGSVDNTANKIINTMLTDNGEQKINWEQYEIRNVALNSDLTITESGVYRVTGTLADGHIEIKPIETGVVKLILDGASVTNSNGPAIFCLAGDDLVVELVGENYLTDGSSYDADYDADITGAFYSRADLTFTGDGTLNINANHQDGIIAKDDLKFNGGNYNIIAADDGIRGKDSVYILKGEFTIESGADAIKSTNEFDAGKGFVLIEDGKFNINAKGKGIKAINNVFLSGGSYVINAYDDAVHSNNYVGIAGGYVEINSADDAVHADRELIIDGGSVNVISSYEGLEAQVVTINGGSIRVIATDDGVNAGGGSDTSTTGPNKDPFKADVNASIAFNGGEVYINADGDGIDSNGTVYFNGGKVTVDGPTNNGNGSLDAGGGVIMNDGEMIAVGSSGMAIAPNNNSLVPSISVFISGGKPAGTLIEISDPANNVVMTHTAAKTFSHITAGSAEFVLGESYTVYLDGESYVTLTLNNVVTTYGSNAMRNTNVNNPRR